MTLIKVDGSLDAQPELIMPKSQMKPVLWRPPEISSEI